MSRIAAAERAVAAPPHGLFAYLADLEQHWELADRFIEVVSLDEPADGRPAKGGIVRMRGPLGIRRAARTRVIVEQPPTRLSGIAEVGSGTVARVTWTLQASGAGTHVRLEATVERSSLLDRALLSLGAGRWLERRFESILETLARRTDPAGHVAQSVSA